MKHLCALTASVAILTLSCQAIAEEIYLQQIAGGHYQGSDGSYYQKLPDGNYLSPTRLLQRLPDNNFSGSDGTFYQRMPDGSYYGSNGDHLQGSKPGKEILTR